MPFNKVSLKAPLKILSLFFVLIASQIHAHAFASEQGVYEDETYQHISYQQLSDQSEPQQFAGIIASHNKVRQKLNQHPLSWSDSLANYAQQWVNRLAETENCSMLHRPNYEGEPDSENYLQIHGENLFWASPETLGNGQTKLQNVSNAEVVNAWAEEEDYYDYQTNSCQPGKVCGHFTQMVWHESRQVGCAKAICPDKSQIWACNYHPRGNYIGELPY